MITLPVSLDNGNIPIPAYAHEGDAGLDIRSAESVSIEPFHRALVSTGMKIELPDGYAGFIVPRSGLAAHHGISIVNAPGLIDSNYRGEIKVILINLDPDETFYISEGDRIAQLVVVAIENVQVLQKAISDDTERGSSGFGSSGVK